MSPIEASVALNMVPHLGPVRMRKLLEVFGTPEAILQARLPELRGVAGIGEEVATAIAQWETRVDLPGEMARVKEFGASILPQSAPEFPADLRQIHNPPILLYVWGELKEADRHAIGVVGSRKTSHYGLESAKKLSYQLAFAGLTVVSGLARGIDTAAHQGALAAKGRTVAVIGSGLMDLYPPENAGLAARIADGGGAVVSEFPMLFPPSRETFPYRNRIVAGWGSGVLVIEAGLASGALITASQALEHGRTVYAVPGQIDRPTSMGSNRLIQQGAKLVTGAEDILEEMNTLFPAPSLAKKPAAAPADTDRPAVAAKPLSPDEEVVLSALHHRGECTLDALIDGTGMPAAKVSTTLLLLEMKKRVKPLAGQRYVPLSAQPA